MHRGLVESGQRSTRVIEEADLEELEHDDPCCKMGVAFSIVML